MPYFTLPVAYLYVTTTPQITTLPLHDALPIPLACVRGGPDRPATDPPPALPTRPAPQAGQRFGRRRRPARDRKSTRLNSSHVAISYAVSYLKEKITSKNTKEIQIKDTNQLER